uniref:CST complex subunit CTC1 n=1 Tax=Setaria italica TaxID=4555 RepID=K3ZQ83_SETIT
MEPPPEPALTPRRLTVADLLRLRRPTTGASSLHFPSAPTTPSPPRKKSKLAAATAGPTPTSTSGTAPFAPISHPVLLSGTLSLPSEDAPAGCRSNCFSFSDPASSASASPAASVCCCLLDFDPAALGREIRVLAWNYLPSVRLHGAAGVLEVVRWRLAEEEEPAPAPKRSFLAKIRLNWPAQDPDLASRGCVFGLVRSVSVVFSMPQAKAEKRSASSIGFLAEILCCGCRRCQVSPPETAQDHKFEVIKFLYFVGSACTWRPLLVWLVGRLVYISGLKKKLVSVAEKGSHTMLVSSTNTAMAWCRSYRGNLPLDGSPEKCGGVYAGVVTGIYLQGLAVELDDTVWLLIDDLLLLPPHCLRVGAFISVKNFHAMRLNFAWTGTVLLATCSKTCLTVKSFSLVDSKSHIKAESKSLLGKFVDSLEMPSRFWMLLLISCFIQKFTKLFSDKEIWGSQNTSPLSGRLQLVDSTGCIDVIIPDLPPNGSLYGIYEIRNYKLALEGPVAYLDHCDVADPLSCKAIFQKLSYKKRVHHLNMYVILCWRELNPIGPSLHIPLHINYRARSFHLVKLSHIFPPNNVQQQNMSGPILYAEAVILPYNLQFIGQGECIEHAEAFRMSHSHLLDGTVLNERIVCEREHTSRILLEFKEGGFIKYQLLRINGYYLLQCPSGSLTCTTEGCGCLEGGKVSLDSQDKIWSIAITFDGNISIKGTIGNQSVRVTSAEVDEPFPRNIIRDELKLVQSWNDFYCNSYFHLDFSCEAMSTKMEEYNTVCHVLNQLRASSTEVLSVSSCIDIMMPKEASGSANLKTEEAVRGDLISVQGKVENIHSHACKRGTCMPANEKYSLCIHVADNNHTVRLHGFLSKHSFIVGMGPGATVTFHRVLLTQHELLLTPVTYIEVATVLKLVLDKSINHGKIPNVKVRLAGFILDDGSSLCCCWADDARAELLLRLQEVAHLDASVNLKLSKGGDSTKLQHTVGYCLEKLLKRHTCVIVKNCGIPPDFSCRDLDASSVLHKVLSRFEDKLLKFIILNACWNGTLNVIASVINPDDLNGFNVELPDFPVRNMQMLWIKEVFPVDPLEEARRLFGILETS